jgi:hypothetical protein
MNWEPLVAWLDNPIFVKHLRSRLRTQPLAAAVVVVFVLCLCICWGAYQLDTFTTGRGFETLVVLQGIILIVMGSAQISSSVGGSKASGIIDFHRVSPLTATELTLGFFFGAPIREYILFACTLPFAALFMAFGVPTVHGFVQLMIFLLAMTWLFHGFTLLNALIRSGHRSARGAAGVVLVFVLVFVNALRMGRFIPSVALFDEDGRLNFYGLSLPWLAVVLLYVGSILYFVFLAARRRMGSERIHPLSKPQAIAALGVFAVVLLGGVWHQSSPGIVLPLSLYLLVITALLAIMMVTPDRAEYFKGLVRAHRLGRIHLPWWSDLALNRVFLVVACAIILVAQTASFSVAGDGSSPPLPRDAFPMAIAIGVLVTAYFGLAYQYYILNFGARGRVFFALFLFLAWVLPLVAGTIVAMSSSGGGGMESQIIFSVSPIPGLALVAASNDGTNPLAIQGPAISLPLLFLFVFNGLLISARRRAYKEFLTTIAKGEPGAPAHQDAQEIAGWPVATPDTPRVKVSQ